MKQVLPRFSIPHTPGIALESGGGKDKQFPIIIGVNILLLAIDNKSYIKLLAIK